MASSPGSALELYRPAPAQPPLYQRSAADVAALVEARVAMAFRVDNGRRQQHRSIHRLTISGLGRCLRAAAYAMAGTPRSEPEVPEEARQAALGTWIHEHLLPLMRQLTPRSVIEMPVVLKAGGVRLTGTLDWLWIDGDGFCEIGDLKTVREWKLNAVDRDGVPGDHEFQVWAYALAASQLGLKVRWVWWLYLDRATGQIRVKVQDFTNEKAFQVVQRVAAIAGHAAGDPDRAPREERGPGLSPVCDGCPWLTRCWGGGARRGRAGAQKILSMTSEGIIEALELLFRSNGIKSNAERDAEFAKLVLAEVPPGLYGPYTLRHRATGHTINQQMVRADYESRREPLPVIRKSPAMIVSSSHPKS